ncbi:fungal-specific transcription factor domain-containing protein [Aspergillus pseudoustus]|uniref:Fungal-specific transcription factor domain-containing protein n=1 Tax=Aspergillus pseudoustus TaxID=1810923 RepID=A0ABR4KCA9_9EURO
MENSSGMKRQRVGVACDKCRLLKAKCDGRQPVCSRCDGYGFTCSWSRRKYGRSPEGETSLRRQGVDNSHDAVASSNTTRLHTANANTVLKSYEALIRQLLPNADPAQQANIEANLQNIQIQLRDTAPTEQPTPDTTATSQEGYTAESSPTYVGKASDIHFVHHIHKYVTGQDSLDGDDRTTQIYTHHNLGSFVTLTQPPLVPSPAEAEQFLDVYLSTIHIAYPFICKSVLRDRFNQLLAGDHDRPEFQPWLALFNFIFAIGSYYTSFPHGKHDNSCHHVRFFEQGLFFSRGLGADCALVNIWILLVQCFFLLAICHTDRCWNTLGFAIRMGQSIGLHVENSSNSLLSKEPWMKDRANCRRTWYAMYVLDRLLALQLGRPMAIHEADFQVNLPSTTDDAPFCTANGDATSQENHSTCEHMMDYFIAVIRFSHIIGLVIRELYRPSQIDFSPDQMLHSAATLDGRLTEWKMNLPRHLRFDIGHTFENSIPFKRQRNMLAVKFHHLRALIHRPFLCLPFIQMNNIPFMNLLLQHKERISEAEYICIYEAQQTAHLIHNVTDERSLVHDFPWWQMISCLVCASSILFVAEAFCGDNGFFHGRTSPQALREDAESCLKVFEALSVNSIAARKAADMLSALSRVRHTVYEGPPLEEPHPLRPFTPMHSAGGNAGSGLSAYSPPHPDTTTSLAATNTPSNSAPYTLPSSLLSTDTICSWDWPSEISSAMEWSIQFLDHPSFGQARTSDTGGRDSTHS